MKLIHSNIEFYLGKEKVVFDIVHSLPIDTPFAAALENWAVRTKVHDVHSFCLYMSDKHPLDLIIPKKVYDKYVGGNYE